MNTEFFIAKKIHSKGNGKLSRPIITVAIIGIALGMAVMILSVCIVTGFQSEIRDKVIGFGGHIQINHYDDNSNSYEASPVSRKQNFYPSIESVDGIRHIQVYATKAGIIKTESDIEGVVLKGIGEDYDFDFISDKMVEGTTINVSDTVKTNDVMVSAQTAAKLDLKLNDDLIMYFIQQPPRVRKFRIAGIYKTGLEDFDKLYVFGDIRHIQKLNDWNQDQVGGFEVYLDEFDEIDNYMDVVYEEIGFDLNAKSIKDMYTQIFDWLQLQNINVQIILVLMVLVAGINMISALLILILERTTMIGVLKAIGADNRFIRKIFMINSVFLILRGLFWGNLIGIGLCMMQIQFGIIKLDQASYYVSTVPVNLNFSYIILLNIGTIIACMAMMVIPSMIVTRISPVKAIKFQ